MEPSPQFDSRSEFSQRGGVGRWNEGSLEFYLSQSVGEALSKDLHFYYFDGLCKLL